MAFVVLANAPKHRRYRVISHEQALLLWNVKAGRVIPTPELQAKADKVRRVFLAWDKAPDSYKRAYPRAGDEPIDSTPLQYKEAA